MICLSPFFQLKFQFSPAALPLRLQNDSLREIVFFAHSALLRSNSFTLLAAPTHPFFITPVSYHFKTGHNTEAPLEFYSTLTFPSTLHVRHLLHHMISQYSGFFLLGPRF